MGDKVYLGDAVYVEFDKVIAGDVLLTTEDGYSVTNAIYVEPQVFASLHKLYETAQLQRAAIED